MSAGWMSPLLSFSLIFWPLTLQFPCSRMPSLSCPPMREPYLTFKSQRNSTCSLKPNSTLLCFASASFTLLGTYHRPCPVPSQAPHLPSIADSLSMASPFLTFYTPPLLITSSQPPRPAHSTTVTSQQLPVCLLSVSPPSSPSRAPTLTSL